MNSTSTAAERSPAYDLLLLVGLCPLLAGADTFVDGIGLALAVIALGTVTFAILQLTQRWMPQPQRLLAALLILALLVAFLELMAAAWLYQVRRDAGLYLALLSVNLAMLWQVHEPSGHRALARLLQLTGSMAGILVLMGLAREIVGRGSLFSNAQVLGAWAAELETPVFRTDMGFLLAMLAPGGFIALGILLALRNRFAQYRRGRQSSSHSSSRP